MVDEGLSDDEKEKVRDIVDNLDRKMEMPPYDNTDNKQYSRQYKEYRKEEKQHKELSRYEKLCQRMGSLLNLTGNQTINEKLSPPLRLLNWQVSPGMVLSAAIGVGFFGFIGWSGLTFLNSMLGNIIPFSLMMITAVIPIGLGIYTFYLPIFAAKNKVINSSDEIILSILYMVVYMRSSPNLEGAIRFAALNLDGPISQDFKKILWNVEMGENYTVDEALNTYAKAWKNYNEDFIESLDLIRAAVNEANAERREKLLEDSIDKILDGTREKMKHYAQSLKMPVMVLNAMGAMLPVLGMIMLPLISVFMGGAITSMHLFITFNILLPGFLYVFMQRVLSSRPPTVKSETIDDEVLPETGIYTIEFYNRSFNIPTRPLGAAIFLFIAAYGILGYVIFPFVYPIQLSEAPISLSSIPELFQGQNGASPIPMLVRSVVITSGLGLGIGVTKYLGSQQRKKAQDHLKKIESQFPTALFKLGNNISGGTPIELALQQAAEASKDLEISNLFTYASRNVTKMGMTFEEALFDSEYGALKQFPSKTIHTVMKAITKSSEKGTKMASMTMTTISRYLEDIHKTQEKLNDMMEETTTTIMLLGYMLAPIISGVAVGMSQTIIISMYRLSSRFEEIQTGASATQGPGTGTDYSSIIGNLDAAISPELLQFVVGFYLIQLLYILGAFYTKIQYGEDKTMRNLFTGKLLISGIIFYTITLMVITTVFGGLVPSAIPAQ
jgi:Flp pilus assembly protein TadB